MAELEESKESVSTAPVGRRAFLKTAGAAAAVAGGIDYEKWFLTQEAYRVGATKVWENHAMWGRVDEPLKMFRTVARTSRPFGYAGPSTAKATEAFTKYIITDTYAKAAQGMKAEDAVHWAELELKKIYEA
jgi:multiple sugar transport system substrate-binding protein